MDDDDDLLSPSSDTDAQSKRWLNEMYDEGEQELFGEEPPPYDLERSVTKEKSEDKLRFVKDPKLLLMEQIKHVLYNLITDRPENVVDYFEEYVRYLITKGDAVDEKVNAFGHYFDVDSIELEYGKWKELEVKSEEEALEEGTAKGKRDYIFQNRMHHFSDGSISLTQIELYSIALALQLVSNEFNLLNIRFWGKIYGLYKNYYILEADVTADIYKQTMEEEKEKRAEEKEEKIKAEEDEYNPKIRWERVRRIAQYIKPPMPKSTYISPKFAPKEKLGGGLNRKIYFVSNEPAKGYKKLPEVLPIHIVRARQIKRYMTGILEEEVISDPPFDGNEGNYLRAQIARITAGTHLSPLGFFSFYAGEAAFDEDEAEEAGGQGVIPKPEIVANPDYERVPLQDLVDPSMAFWSHHTAHILPQGRAKWVDPNILPRNLRPEGEEPPMEKAEPEVGPPLLTTASEDMNLEMITPWSTRLTMELSPSFGAALVRSNLWPGAFCYSLHNESEFDNIYIGWGMKQNASSFTPVVYFTPQNEYEIGPEVTEITDPDPEEEDYEGILYQKKLDEERKEKRGKRGTVDTDTSF